MSGPTGVLLMTFGSPVGIEDVPRYLTSVRGGHAPDNALVTDFRRRYTLIGGSPLLERTEQQAQALRRQLLALGNGERYEVAVGMRHSSPTIAEGFDALVKSGVKHISGLALSPQYSPVVLAGYIREFQAAAEAHPTVTTSLVGAWHLNEHFIAALSDRLQEALDRFPEAERAKVPIIFTAHSMPKSVADQDPGYVDQLKATALAVAEHAGLDGERWQFAYQSAGHTPVEWLTPDVKDLFPELRAQGRRSVLVVSVQFLSDHLEVLYDIDIAARDEADRAGVRLERTESLNDSPALARALAEAVMAQNAMAQAV
jgi:ferrochelatase